MNKKNPWIFRHTGTALLILVVFFTVGTAGIIINSTRDLFISLTPFALLISLMFIALYHKPQNISKEIIIFVSVYFVSFFIEAAGVSTGRIFGQYRYGEGLGIKILNTPLIIGVNWILLIYCTAAITERYSISPVFKIIISSLLMLAYDFLLEFAAPLMDMWNFENDLVPFKNYLVWFLLAIIFHSVVKLSGVKIVNRLAPYVFYVQAGFFLILAVFFKMTE